MALQANVSATVTIDKEAAFGVAPAAGSATARRARRVSTSINATKATFASNEVRTDQQVSDARHGTQGASGGIQAELSTQTYDPLLAAVLRNNWVAGATSTESAWTTPSLTIAAAGDAYTATFGAGPASLITLGYRAGDIVKFSNLTAALATLNGRLLRINSLTATVMSFGAIDSGTVPTGNNAAWTLALPGSKVFNGILKPSFTIEQNYDDIDLSELFIGMRVGSTAIRVQPNGMASASFDFLGRESRIVSAAQAPYFTAPQPETSTGILTGIGGSLRFGGKDRAVVTGIDMNVNNNLSAPPVVASKFVPEIFYGRSVATGTVTAFLEDESLIGAFLAETEVEIGCILPGALPNADFLSFHANRVKLMGAQKQIGPEGGVIVTFPWQALLTDQPGKDKCTLAIQRSNAA